LDNDEHDKKDDEFVAHESDSDNESVFSDNWSYIGVEHPKEPHSCHHCHFVGHHCTKSPNYKKIKFHSAHI
jgi:hypothetical protein